MKAVFIISMVCFRWVQLHGGLGRKQNAAFISFKAQLGIKTFFYAFPREKSFKRSDSCLFSVSFFRSSWISGIKRWQSGSDFMAMLPSSSWRRITLSLQMGWGLRGEVGMRRQRWDSRMFWILHVRDIRDRKKANIILTPVIESRSGRWRFLPAAKKKKEKEEEEEETRFLSSCPFTSARLPPFSSAVLWARPETFRPCGLFLETRGESLSFFFFFFFFNSLCTAQLKGQPQSPGLDYSHMSANICF